MRFSSGKNTLALTLALVFAGGCDELQDGDDKGPVLSSFKGTISLGEGTPPVTGKLRVALIWSHSIFSLARDPRERAPEQPPLPGCTPIQDFVATQELEFTPSFPINFQLDLTAPPPPDVLVDGEPGSGAKLAYGALVAYEDGNGNGKLDICRAAGHCPDHVLGASTSLGLGIDHLVRPTFSILYLDRALEEDGKTYQPGFHVFRSGASLEGKNDFQLLAANAPIDLVLSEGSILQRLVCDQGCGVPPAPGFSLQDFCSVTKTGTEVCQPPPPIPAGARLNCLPGNRGYFWSTELCSGCTCSGKRGGFILHGNATPPADWPCK